MWCWSLSTMREKERECSFGTFLAPWPTYPNIIFGPVEFRQLRIELEPSNGRHFGEIMIISILLIIFLSSNWFHSQMYFHLTCCPWNPCCLCWTSFNMFIIWMKESRASLWIWITLLHLTKFSTLELILLNMIFNAETRPQISQKKEESCVEELKTGGNFFAKCLDASGCLSIPTKREHWEEFILYENLLWISLSIFRISLALLEYTSFFQRSSLMESVGQNNVSCSMSPSLSSPMKLDIINKCLKMNVFYVRHDWVRHTQVCTHQAIKS